MKPTGSIVIIGFMGCGKTAVARALAQRLNMPMLDLDEVIAERYQRTAAQLIRDEGEPAFRAIETKVLQQLCESGARSVIALGGGAWITEANRGLIDQYSCMSVWLDAPFDLCWQRIAASDEDRPLGRTREQAEQLYRARHPVYQQARIHVPVAIRETIENIVSRIASQLTQKGHG